MNLPAWPANRNVKKDRAREVVTDRDIVCRGLAAGLDLNRATARDVMSKGIFYCTETEELAEAARTMEQNKVRRLPVINQNQALVKSAATAILFTIPKGQISYLYQAWNGSIPCTAL